MYHKFCTAHPTSKTKEKEKKIKKGEWQGQYLTSGAVAMSNITFEIRHTSIQLHEEEGEERKEKLTKYSFITFY